MSFTVKFYQDARGRCPVAEFIGALTKKEQAAVLRAIDRQVDRGTEIPFPHARHIGGKLWELRVRHNRRAFRFFYFVAREGTIIHLHAIVKARNALHQNDIDIATGRMNDVLEGERKVREWGQ